MTTPASPTLVRTSWLPATGTRRELSVAECIECLRRAGTGHLAGSANALPQVWELPHRLILVDGAPMVVIDAPSDEICEALRHAIVAFSVTTMDVARSCARTVQVVGAMRRSTGQEMALAAGLPSRPGDEPDPRFAQALTLVPATIEGRTTS